MARRPPRTPDRPVVWSNTRFALLPGDDIGGWMFPSIGLSWRPFGVLIASEAFLGRLFARFDAAACSLGNDCHTHSREGTVVLGLENIAPSLRLSRRKS
jgi:hypothetical protein